MRTGVAAFERTDLRGDIEAEAVGAFGFGRGLRLFTKGCDVNALAFGRGFFGMRRGLATAAAALLLIADSVHGGFVKFVDVFGVMGVLLQLDFARPKRLVGGALYRRKG